MDKWIEIDRWIDSFITMILAKRSSFKDIEWNNQIYPPQVFKLNVSTINMNLFEGLRV